MPIQNKQSSITVHGESDRSVALIPTTECLDLLDLAALISQQRPPSFHYRFTSLLLAFAYTKHRISVWFRNYVLNSNVDLSSILVAANVSGGDEAMQKLAGQSLDPNSLYSGGLRYATASALAWIERAKGYSEQQMHAWVGLRHMMGALIFDLKFHEEELRGWGFSRDHWASEYLQFLGEQLPDDLEFWKTVRARAFPHEPTDFGKEPKHRTVDKAGREKAAWAKAPWILVIGTGRTPLSAEVREAADLLGFALSKAGFNLATFGWTGVDAKVAESFSTASGLNAAKLEERLVHFIGGDRGPVFGGGWVMNFSTEEDAASAAIGYADAVIIIGGGRRSYAFAKRALDANILLLPMACTSGKNDPAAGNLYEIAIGPLERHAEGLITPSTVRALKGPIPSAVTFTVKLLGDFFEQHPEVKEKPDRWSPLSIGQNGPRVYVSFNVRDWASVRPIVKELMRREIPLWVDQWELKPGDNWQPRIDDAKAKSPLWLVFLGPAGPGPSHGKEIEEAMDKAASSPPVLSAIPILLPGFSGQLPALFQQLMRCEFRTIPDQRAFDSLYRSIQTILKGIQIPEQSSPHPRVAELVADPQRLGTFCARFAFHNRSALPLLEAPDSVALADALRTSGLTTQDEVADYLHNLESNPETASLKPNALWLAWFTAARREKLDQIGKDLLTLPRDKARADEMPKAPDEPSIRGSQKPTGREKATAHKHEPPAAGAASDQTPA